MPELIHRRFDDPGPTLGETGEAALVAALTAAAQPFRGRLSRASGDDAAVYSPEAGRDLVMSQDATVEGVDFERGWITPYQLGARAYSVAVSDLAGMGARPEICLATVCAPAATCRDDLLAMQAGLVAAATATGCAVAGGDVSAIDGPLVIDVSVTGSTPMGRHLARDAGIAGDLLLVTGHLGRAAAGLALVRGQRLEAAEADLWREAQLAPQPRLQEGMLALELGLGCGGDISDGLLVEARRTAAASGCGAEIWLDSLPVDTGLRQLLGWEALALAGGEDFELLLAVPEARWPVLRDLWSPGRQTLSVVGRLAPGKEVVCRQHRGGAIVAAPPPVSMHWDSLGRPNSAL